ncbi:glycine-rich domain-containing protein [Streptomyces antimycoticus]|uniref:Uncharacterized protein n=3 Tax=Streptomyces violaceusniger group TaxID=2839105 RepID=A0A4D4KGM7_9ACTN|nr:hypothetical protein [Streptomyces antimycoticus]KUL52006.1 hypothetical protein ADL28_24215 [Streptomyces violaceusniger]GDY47334.1 hypothetical protein SANT12839_082160 [Streptomyces antimycoticus]
MSHGTALLSDEDRASVVDTVMRNNSDMNPALAGRVVDEAVKYVAAVANAPEPLTPSRVVDEGWHALILHTRIYQRLCNKVGRFVHHVPEQPDPENRIPEALTKTQAQIVSMGFTVDDALWLAPEDTSIPVAAHCQHSPGGPEGSCTGSGEGDGPSGPN